MFESRLSTLCPSFDRSTAGENTQARCRMIVLMALANFYGWTMVNTGNKSEAMMGYSTLTAIRLALMPLLAACIKPTCMQFHVG